MTSALVDVVIVGDGPAGSALAQGCARRGLSTCLVGPDADWEATYGCWVDDLAAPGVGVLGLDDTSTWFVQVLDTIRVVGDSTHDLVRPYGVIDNPSLRATLRDGVDHRAGHVERVEVGADQHRVVLARGPELSARLVIDAAGWPSRFAPASARSSNATQPAWQTALGVVLAAPPDGDLGTATLMDLRPVGADGSTSRASTIGPRGVDSFAYAVPVADGWLVEETVLAARPAVEPVALLARLAARLGRHPDELLAEALRTEAVRIPMGGPLPAPDQAVVAFGAAAGFIHPATGYSIAGSLRAVERVADAIGNASEGLGAIDAAVVWDSVWPLTQRRTRVFHDFGLETLTRLDGEGIRRFFDAFFDLPIETWASYLRIDATPAETAQVMTQLFKGSSWSLRRRLALGNPVQLARLIRP